MYTMDEAEERLLRISEASKILALGRSKTYQLVASGELRSVRVGRSIRVTATSVQQFIRSLIEREADQVTAS